MLILLDPEGVKWRSMFRFSIGFPDVVGSGKTNNSEYQGFQEAGKNKQSNRTSGQHIWL